ncbi:hypothetical protein GGR57DRAFT_500920 [Xylariaceae sp. FL1272]|nr:hypothetical protein GGR57DRAFT_500920 [Xylariaceae sp. FL1272]
MLKDSLKKVIDDSARSSVFSCCMSNATFPSPRLSIVDYGDVGLPLAERDAKAIIAHCYKSPFGKGAEILVDDNVRRSWELNVDQFTLRNPAWSAAVENILPKVHKSLGLLCPLQDVRAEPYKLLLYEEGAFVKPHQGRFAREHIQRRCLTHFSGQLDHRYTSATLNLSRLNGSDRVRAECLKAAAVETGAAIFLATAELEVFMNEGDYEDEDEEIERSSRLKGVKTLDGTTVLVSLEYSQDRFINREDFEEGSPDDEEYSGFTGNEGATATYWYPDTVCFVVPQAALDKFRFQGNHRWRWACKRLQELRQAPPTPRLIQFCNSLLQAASRAPETQSILSYIPPYETWNNPEAPAQEACLKDVACIATYPAFRAYVGLASKYKAFIQLEQGFNGASESLNSEVLGMWRCWFETALLSKVLVGAGELTREDGMDLSAIYSSTLREDYKTRIRKMIFLGPMGGMIGFCISMAALVQGQHLNDAIGRPLVRKVLGSIWSDFRLDNAHMAPDVEPIPLPERTRGKFPRGEDIVELVRLVGIYQDPFSSELEHSGAEMTVSRTPPNPLRLSQADCAAKILAACEIADPMDIVGTFLPFIKLVISNKVPFLLTGSDDRQEPTEIAKKIVQCIIPRFATLVIGKQPEAPKTWAISPVGGCPCTDCSRVNAFLRSPTERIGRFPMSNDRRYHLDIVFNDNIGRSGADYAIETIRVCKPHVWQMSKTRLTYDTQLTQWNNKDRAAWPLLLQLLSDQPDDKISEELMGTNMYRALRSENAAALLALSQQSSRGPLLTLNDTNAFGKRARPADGLAAGPSAFAKRVASGDARKHSQSPAIDLTEG